MKRILLALIVIPFFSQAQVTFQKVYGGQDSDDIKSVQQSTDGGYIFTGVTNSFGEGGSDVYLVKTDANGDTLWTRAYGESDTDIGYYVQECNDGSYITAGFSGSFVTGFDFFDFYVIKTDNNGDTLWTKTYGGTGDDLASVAQQCNDSGYIVTGLTDSYGAGMMDVYLIKTNSSGDAIWSKTYGGTNDDVGFCVQQTIDSGYIISGTTMSFGEGAEDVYLIKTDPLGDTLWTKTFGGVDPDFGVWVQQCTDSGYIVGGYTQSYGSWTGDLFLIKTDANGDTLWTKTYGGPGYESGGSVQQTTDGGYIITGSGDSLGSGGYDNIYLVKTDAAGDTLWTRAFGGTNDDIGQRVRQTADGGYIIAASTNSYAVGSQQSAFLLKTDANGNSDGCNEFNTNTVVGSIPFVVGSGAIVSNTLTTVINPPTIVGNTATYTSVCFPISIAQRSDHSNQFKIYPNPTTGAFTVQGATGAIEVYDLFGRKVTETRQQEIDLSEQPKGMYVVRAGQAVRKVVLH